MDRKKLEKEVKERYEEIKRQKTTTLDIYIEGEKDFYSEFSGEHNIDINPDLKDYIFRQRLYVDNLVIHVKEDLNEIQKAQMINVLENTLVIEIQKTKKQNQGSLVKNAVFILLGIFFISLSYFVSHREGKIFNEIYMVIGWFLVWEFANSIFLNNPIRRFKYYQLLNLYNAPKIIDK